jgi:hypothetical protein
MPNPVPWAPRSIRSQPFRSAGIVEVDTSRQRSAEYSSDASNYQDSPAEPSSSSLPTGSVYTSPNYDSTWPQSSSFGPAQRHLGRVAEEGSRPHVRSIPGNQRGCSGPRLGSLARTDLLVVLHHGDTARA